MLTFGKEIGGTNYVVQLNIQLYLCSNVRLTNYKLKVIKYRRFKLCMKLPYFLK